MPTTTEDGVMLGGKHPGPTRGHPARARHGDCFPADFGAILVRRMLERMADDERSREFPRYEVEAFVDFTGGEILLNHRIQNLSLGGLCIQTDAIEEVGTMVDLVINFPDLEASFTARGQVVWTNREAPRDMGIRFLDLDNERKDTLRRYIGMVRKA